MTTINAQLFSQLTAASTRPVLSVEQALAAELAASFETGAARTRDELVAHYGVDDISVTYTTITDDASRVVVGGYGTLAGIDIAIVSTVDGDGVSHDVEIIRCADELLSGVDATTAVMNPAALDGKYVHRLPINTLDELGATLAFLQRAGVITVR